MFHRRRNSFKRSRRRRSRGGFPWRNLLLILLAAAFVYFAVRLAIYGAHSADNRRTNAELNSLYEAPVVGEGRSSTAAEETAAPQTTEASAADQPQRPATYQFIGGEITPSAEALYEINPDLVAWLEIPDILRLPVVYRDNSYYLTHDFYGRESDAGTLFLDVNHPLKARNQYLIIHGHNMYDASMFGKLTHYRKKDFLATHPTLTLTTLYSKDTYEIVGSLYVEEADMVDIAGLGRPRFADTADFNRFIETFRSRAIYFTDAEIPPDTALLALATCHESGRMVVLFRRTSATPLVPSA